MRLVFMGSDPIALPLLEAVAETCRRGTDLCAVYTQPDRPHGRGMHLQANAIKQWAVARGVPVRQPEKCGAEEAGWLAQQGVTQILVMAYGQILRKSLLAVPPLGVINFHASLLPRLRGASPIHTAVALGLPQTGVSLMRIIPALDAGPVADAEPVPILPDDTSQGVAAKLAVASATVFRRNWDGLCSGELQFREQDPAEVTYCRIIDKADAHLDFAAPAVALVNRIRALQPWPGTSFPHGGCEVKVLRARAADGVNAAPGTVVDIDNGLRIACGQGSLVAQVLQRPGGRPLEAAAFLRGWSLRLGDCLASRPMRPLESPNPFDR